MFIIYNTHQRNELFVRNVIIVLFPPLEALSPEEKARLDELAEAEKNKALQKKKEAEDKKKKIAELEEQKK